LLIKFHVSFPERLEPEQITAIAEALGHKTETAMNVDDAEEVFLEGK
jgi:hypothetical protein